MTEKLRFSYENPRDLTKNDWNPNEMSPESEAKLRNSLERHGHIRPILIRELEDGTKEVVGGAHRRDLSIELGHDKVPVLNLGRISDEQAKKTLLLDNSRYGEDEASKLAELLSDIGDAEELSEWLAMDLDDLTTLMGSVGGDEDLELLDDLDDLDEDKDEYEAPTKELQTHQVMKFKVPIEDAETIKEMIEGVIREQGIEDSDSAIRSGDALLWLIRQRIEQNMAELDDDELGLNLPMPEDEE